MSNNLSVKTKRVRFAPLAIATGVFGAALLAVSMSGTMSGFVASITNSANTAGSGSLIMQEQNSATTPVTCLSTDNGTVSTNASTCSTINKFGGSMAMTPGTAVTSTVTIRNTGTVNASTFTLASGNGTTAGSCVQSNNGASNGTATDLCSKMDVVITNTTTSSVVFTGTLATLASHAAFPLAAQAAGTSTTFTFAVTLDTTAGNTYQGLQASLPLTWSFAS